jgi:hypothetical protein
VRAVRNSLGIHICGQDEVGGSGFVPNVSEPPKQDDENSTIRDMLSSILEKNGISFDKFQNRMIVLEDKGQTFAAGARDWKSIQDVPADNIFKIISVINEGIEKKKAAAKAD